MTAEISKDDRKVYIEEGKIKQSINQIQSFDPINVYNMLEHWKDRVKQATELELEMPEVLKEEYEAIKQRKELELQELKKEAVSCQKGIDFFAPVLDEWSTNNPKDYEDMINTVNEAKSKVRQQITEEIKKHVE